MSPGRKNALYDDFGTDNMDIQSANSSKLSLKNSARGKTQQHLIHISQYKVVLRENQNKRDADSMYRKIKLVCRLAQSLSS